MQIFWKEFRINLDWICQIWKKSRWIKLRVDQPISTIQRELSTYFSTQTRPVSKNSWFLGTTRTCLQIIWGTNFHKICSRWAVPAKAFCSKWSQRSVHKTEWSYGAGTTSSWKRSRRQRTRVKLVRSWWRYWCKSGKVSIIRKFTTLTTGMRITLRKALSGNLLKCFGDIYGWISMR